MSSILTKDILLLRLMIIKDKRNYYIAKDYKGHTYKLLKGNDYDFLEIGDDRYHFVENLGSTLLFKYILRPLNKAEEHDLLSISKTYSLDELGTCINIL